MLFCAEKSVAICWLVVHVFHMCCKLRVYIALLCVLRHLMADERDVAAGGLSLQPGAALTSTGEDSPHGL